MKDTALPRRRALLLGCALALSLGLAHLPAGAMPGVGEKAPEFAGYTYDGKSISLSTYAGKVVVLSFWASWCGPCLKELPMLEGIQKVAGKDRVQVIAVNIQSLDIYRKIARKMDSLQMLVATDWAAEAQKDYGVTGIPHMVIIGKDGMILRVNRGYTEEGVDEVVKDLNRALQ